MPYATREQREDAEKTVESVREDVRDWAKTADPSEDFEVYDIIDGYLTYTNDYWNIVFTFGLENEEPELEPRDSTLDSLAQLLAFEYLEQVAYKEWEEVQAERDNGDIFWCDDCGEWHEKEYECDDCEDGICPKKVVKSEDSEAAYCEDCATDHTCQECQAVDSTVEFDSEAGHEMCANCVEKREAEQEAEHAREREAEAEAESRFERE
jgi:hypothetical protein